MVEDPNSVLLSSWKQSTQYVSRTTSYDDAVMESYENSLSTSKVQTQNINSQNTCRYQYENLNDQPSLSDSGKFSNLLDYASIPSVFNLSRSGSFTESVDSKSGLDQSRENFTEFKISESISDIYINTSSTLGLSSSNLFGSDSVSNSQGDGFNTPREGFVYVPFFNPHLSAPTSPQERKVSTGMKRSSPNDVTVVPDSSGNKTDDMADPDNSEGSSPSPSRLYSEFIIDEIIGTGIFGTVYRVRSRTDNNSYAIKRSRRQYRGRYDKHKMLREVDTMQALSLLEDLNSMSTIVKYVSYWMEDHFLCIQMELCDLSVEAILASHPPQEVDTFVLLYDVLLALSTLHRNDYVHLDVKPANIMRKRDRFKLGDFGLAVHTNHGRAASSAIEEGDCRYMARELLDWGPVSDLTKCDVFSLGVTSYEIATRFPSPINGPKWHALRDGTFVIPSTVPVEIEQILRALLNPVAENRPSCLDCLLHSFPSFDPNQSFLSAVQIKLEEVNCKAAK